MSDTVVISLHTEDMYRKTHYVNTCFLCHLLPVLFPCHPPLQVMSNVILHPESEVISFHSVTAEDVQDLHHFMLKLVSLLEDNF